MVVVQLAMVELVTRVRTQQRMLPSTLFLRITWRWKDLQRYFWQWDDFFSYVYFLLALTGVLTLVTLVGRYVPGYAEALGLVSLGLEAFQALPQFLRNRQEGVGVEGLSLVLVGAWIVGDSVKTAYFAWHPSLPRQFVMGGVIQLLVDTAICYQVWAYRRRHKDHAF